MTNGKLIKNWLYTVAAVGALCCASCAAEITTPFGITKTVTFHLRGYQSYTNGGYWYNTYFDVVDIPATITIGTDTAEAAIDWDSMTWNTLGSCRNAEHGNMETCFIHLSGNAHECYYALDTSYYPCHNGTACDGGDASSASERNKARNLMRNKLKKLSRIVTIPRGSSSPGAHNAIGSSIFKSGTPAARVYPLSDDTYIGSDFCLYDVTSVTAN